MAGGICAARLRSGQLHPALISHLSKYRSPETRLPSAAVRDGRCGWGRRVGRCRFLLDHTRQATAGRPYLESHAQRVYSCIVAPQMRAAIELADKIKCKRRWERMASFCWARTSRGGAAWIRPSRKASRRCAGRRWMDPGRFREIRDWPAAAR